MKLKKKTTRDPSVVIYVYQCPKISFTNLIYGEKYLHLKYPLTITQKTTPDLHQGDIIFTGSLEGLIFMAPGYLLSYTTTSKEVAHCLTFFKLFIKSFKYPLAITV